MPLNNNPTAGGKGTTPGSQSQSPGGVTSPTIIRRVVGADPTAQGTAMTIEALRGSPHLPSHLEMPRELLSSIHKLYLGNQKQELDVTIQAFDMAGQECEYTAYSLTKLGQDLDYRKQLTEGCLCLC
jgi:hypothetical protein